MNGCGCTYQGAQCFQGKELFVQVSRLYALLNDPYHARVTQEVREQWWQEYEQWRDVYCKHVEECVRCS